MTFMTSTIQKNHQGGQAGHAGNSTSNLRISSRLLVIALLPIMTGLILCLTVNKHLSLLSSVLRWSVKHDYLTKNPAEGLQLDIRMRADEERKAYDLDDIKQILQNLPPKESSIPLLRYVVANSLLSLILSAPI